MAKGKRATALFEVMSKHKGAGRSGGTAGGGGGGGIPTPKWWFKSQGRADVRTYAPGEPLSDHPAVDVADEVLPAHAIAAAPDVSMPPSTPARAPAPVRTVMDDDDDDRGVAAPARP